ncbi:hypothetical protein [Streptomyces sp. NPDC005408]|uniref:hypothetical protein n=1 Tax=Streptomyces sp. NPDC005408 TaxID=3155341 RepID=UPI0033AB5DB8
MLKPIDAERVIRDRQVSGRFPGDLHEGVAWWVAACFVAAAKTHRMAVAYDGRESTEQFRRHFHQGAINAQHFACHIHDLGQADETQLLHAMKHLGAPGAHLSTTPVDDVLVATIRLYEADGELLDEDTGLARIRDMIARDQVPIPVNAAAKGRVEDHSGLLITLGGGA